MSMFIIVSRRQPGAPLQALGYGVWTDITEIQQQRFGTVLHPEHMVERKLTDVRRSLGQRCDLTAIPHSALAAAR